MKRSSPGKLALAIGGIGIATAAAYAASRTEAEPEAGALIGIAGPACLGGDARGPEKMAFFKLAQAQQEAAGPVKNELKPFRGSAPRAGVGTDYDPPLWTNLGTLNYRVATSSPQAQKYFDQGLRLAYAFNHAEARSAFRKAQQLDAACAMCWWGEALVLGPNINAPMEASANAPALAAVARAQELAAGTSPRERALIEALAARYSADPKAERAALDAAYAEAMGRVAARFPRDRDIAVLHAEALMDLSPWDYWEAAGTRPKGRAAEILAILERVLEEHPNHAGAIHYYIHMVEASSDPQRAEPYARRLGAAMPGAGHLVHMPFHIFYRVGKYREALAANRAAVAADEAYIAQAKPEGIYPQAYYPHNVHSLMVSAQMAGDGKTVIAAAQKLARVVSDEAARSIAWVQPIKAAPYFAHAQFSDAATVMSLPDPGAGLPYVRAMWHYARGVAQAAAGDAAAAAGEAAAIGGIAQRADFADLVAGGVPAKELLDIARLVVEARVAQARGDLDGAIRGFAQAAQREEQLPYMEPPFWYYPLRQSLGAALLLAGRTDEAEQAFRASLVRAPNNGWALYGLSEVFKRRGDSRSAGAAERLLAKAWAGERNRLELARL